MPTSADTHPPCIHCGMNHPGQCLRVKAIEYNPDLSIKRVEYHLPTPSEWQAFKIGMRDQ